jgi:hypothetical protein
MKQIEATASNIGRCTSKKSLDSKTLPALHCQRVRGRIEHCIWRKLHFFDTKDNGETLD